MKCVECGLCKGKCPMVRAVLKETASPRMKGKLHNMERADKLAYFCALCGMHDKECPYNADVPVIKMREKLVKNGVELSKTKEMVENIKNHGSAFKE
ncbi:MAG: (Fe-S)-binding protein [Nanoarchaeota archaeon]|nr:(Fe-S)-binding protein [Nanoarchaeota archaeon]